MKTLHPTGSCFDDVADFIKERVLLGHITRKHLNTVSFRIVHGICLFKGDGDPYSHCWIESAGKCMDGRRVNGERVMIEYPKKEFYKLFRVQDCTKHTIQETMDLEAKHGRPGPWEQKYIELCKDFKEGRYVRTQPHHFRHLQTTEGLPPGLGCAPMGN